MSNNYWTIHWLPKMNSDDYKCRFLVCAIMLGAYTFVQFTPSRFSLSFMFTGHSSIANSSQTAALMPLTYVLRRGMVRATHGGHEFRPSLSPMVCLAMDHWPLLATLCYMNMVFCPCSRSGQWPEICPVWTSCSFKNRFSDPTKEQEGRDRQGKMSLMIVKEKLSERLSWKE